MGIIIDQQVSSSSGSSSNLPVRLVGNSKDEGEARISPDSVLRSDNNQGNNCRSSKQLFSTSNFNHSSDLRRDSSTCSSLLSSASTSTTNHHRHDSILHVGRPSTDRPTDRSAYGTRRPSVDFSDFSRRFPRASCSVGIDPLAFPSRPRERSGFGQVSKACRRRPRFLSSV